MLLPLDHPSRRGKSSWDGCPHNLSDDAVMSWLDAEDDAPPEVLDAELRASVLKGLRRRPKAHISHTFLYDEPGSTLYEEICKTPEYFLTLREGGLVVAQAADIAADLHGEEGGDNAQVVIELGSGDGHKTLSLLRALRPLAERTIYAPLDLSADALNTNVTACAVMASSEPGNPVRARAHARAGRQPAFDARCATAHSLTTTTSACHRHSSLRSRCRATSRSSCPRRPGCQAASSSSSWARRSATSPTRTPSPSSAWCEAIFEPTAPPPLRPPPPMLAARKCWLR